jgi:hypothetical protein
MKSAKAIFQGILVFAFAVSLALAITMFSLWIIENELFIQWAIGMVVVVTLYVYVIYKIDIEVDYKGRVKIYRKRG